MRACLSVRDSGIADDQLLLHQRGMLRLSVDAARECIMIQPWSLNSVHGLPESFNREFTISQMTIRICTAGSKLA
jgi:hypothetical protein